MFSVVIILVPGQPDHYDRERQRPRRQHRKRPHRAAERNAIIVDSQSPKHRVLKLWSEAQSRIVVDAKGLQPRQPAEFCGNRSAQLVAAQVEVSEHTHLSELRGIGPLNRLPNRLRFSTPLNSPSSGGIGPLNWLPDKLKLRLIRPSSDVPYLSLPN